MVDKGLIKICQDVLFPTGQCVSCEGEFQFNEHVYRDFDNKEYCEVCYKEKYKEFI